MKPFLSQGRRDFLREMLVTEGHDIEIAAGLIDFPEGEEDTHVAAHAAVMTEASTNEEIPPEQAKLYLYNSSIFLMAIAEEAKERGLTVGHFPKGYTTMNKFMEEQKRSEQ